MKSIFLFAFLSLFLIAPSFAAEHSSTASYNSIDLAAPVKQPSKAKIAREALKAKMHGKRVEDIILLILAIFIPPLAVYLDKGIGNEFWIDLILTLLFFFPGMLFALYVIFVK
jgi:uncharacterized membrane protein YqaE (UPF0057 family)